MDKDTVNSTVETVPLLFVFRAIFFFSLMFVARGISLAATYYLVLSSYRSTAGSKINLDRWIYIYYD
jgi:hypothetical protein